MFCINHIDCNFEKKSNCSYLMVILTQVLIPWCVGFFVVFKAYPFWRGTHSYNYLKEVNVLSSACGLIFLTTWIRRKSLMWKWLVKTICGIHLAITYKLRFWRKSWERLMFLGWNWMKWVWSLIEASVPNLER